MPLRAVIEKPDQVEEPLRAFYKEVDGKFVLDVEGVDGFELENVSGLKTALASHKESERKARALLKSFEGLDPALAREALAKWDEVKDLDPNKEADKIATAKMESWKKQVLEEHAKVLGTHKDRTTKLEGEVGRLLIDREAMEQIASRKGSPKLLLPIIKQMTRWRIDEGTGACIVEVLDEKGNPRIGDANGAAMTIGQLVDELRSSTEYGRAFDGTGASGSGAGSGAAAAGAGAGGPGARSRKDLKSDAEKAQFIKKHGLPAFMALPAEG